MSPLWGRGIKTVLGMTPFPLNKPCWLPLPSRLPVLPQPEKNLWILVRMSSQALLEVAGGAGSGSLLGTTSRAMRVDDHHDCSCVASMSLVPSGDHAMQSQLLRAGREV